MAMALDSNIIVSRKQNTQTQYFSLGVYLSEKRNP